MSLPTKLSAETKYVLGSIAEECRRKATDYYAVDMIPIGAVYDFIGMRLEEVAEGKRPPIPKMIFSHTESDHY